MAVVVPAQAEQLEGNSIVYGTVPQPGWQVLVVDGTLAAGGS